MIHYSYSLYILVQVFSKKHFYVYFWPKEGRSNPLTLTLTLTRMHYKEQQPLITADVVVGNNNRNQSLFQYIVI